MFIDKIKEHPRTVVIAILLIALAFGLLVFMSSNQPQNTSQVGVDGPAESESLPFSNYLYSISKIDRGIIEISAYSGYRNAAIYQMYRMGIDPTDYRVEFNYESPFKPYE